MSLAMNIWLVLIHDISYLSLSILALYFFHLYLINDYGKMGKILFS